MATEVRFSERRSRDGQRLVEIRTPLNGPDSWEVREYTMSELEALKATVDEFLENVNALWEDDEA